MAIKTNYSNLRENLAAPLDRITNEQEIGVIQRWNSPDVAIPPASELAGLLETAHLLRSPANASARRGGFAPTVFGDRQT